MSEDRKTPKGGNRSLRARTREAFRFIAPPRRRKIGWYVLVFLVMALALVEVNRWVDGVVWAWLGNLKDWLWDSNPFVPFVVGGLLFRYLWPIRESSEDE